MARPFVLTLPPQHNRELVQARDHATHPDVRAHAAGILQVADGQSLRAVARLVGYDPIDLKR